MRIQIQLLRGRWSASACEPPPPHRRRSRLNLCRLRLQNMAKKTFLAENSHCPFFLPIIWNLRIVFNFLPNRSGFLSSHCYTIQVCQGVGICYEREGMMKGLPGRWGREGSEWEEEEEGEASWMVSGGRGSIVRAKQMWPLMHQYDPTWNNMQHDALPDASCEFPFQLWPFVKNKNLVLICQILPIKDHRK